MKSQEIPARTGGYDWYMWNDLPIEHHPEYPARSILPAAKYADWIEGCLRRHPGYRKSASDAANEHVMSRMDITLYHHATAAADRLHALYRLADASIAQLIQAGKIRTTPEIERHRAAFMFSFSDV